MKNFIEHGPVNWIKASTYDPAFETCNKQKKRTSIKKSLQIFSIVFKSHPNKFASCYKVPLLLILVLLNISGLNAQQEVSYALHANIIYRFTKYIDWPDYDNSGDFVIAIIGDTPLYEALKGFVTNKTVGNRKIVIKKMSSSADSYNCHILFVSEDKSKSLKKIAEVTKGSPILIISESIARAMKGSCINFVVVNEHLKLEINKTNIEDRSLNIASELLRLGTIVK